MSDTTEWAELCAHEEPRKELAPGYTSEEVKALFFDRLALREPPYKVFRLDSDGHRYYYRYCEDGMPEFYPSVTTLLKQVMPTPPALLEWIASNGREAAEKRDLAAAYGTFMHIQFETLVINRKYDFDAAPAVLGEYLKREGLPDKLFTEWLGRIRKDVLAFAQFVRDYAVKPLAVEIGLVHPAHRYAGCVDLPCLMSDPKTGEQYPAIVDFKSGRKGFYEEHELQLLLYREMWNINFPDLPIERVYNFSPKDWRTKPSYNLKEQTASASAAKLSHLLALAALEDGKRDNVLTIVRGVLDLDKGSITDNIVSLSLAELVGKAPSKAEEKGPGRTKKTPSSEPPWEKDLKEGAGIEVEKTDDGVKVTARYFEPTKPAGPTPEEVAKVSLLNDEIEL